MIAYYDNSVEARCIVCQLLFCCGDCRWKHEKIAHGLTYDCPICRGNRFLCRSEELNKDFLKHLLKEHAPLQCRKCNKIFDSMDNFVKLDKCISISELIETSCDKKIRDVDDKFESLYEKVAGNDNEKYEAIVSVNNSTRTAVITPILRKKNIVDYDVSSGSENEETPRNTKVMVTQHLNKLSKTPKLKRQRTAMKHFVLMRQKVAEEDLEEDEEGIFNDTPGSDWLTPARNDAVTGTNLAKDMTTPTSLTPHVIKLAKIVTTSTPTHPVASTWSMFPVPETDSPLSEIESTESPAQSMDKEPSKPKENIQPKLKSIIGRQLGSQDSTEKQVTFQDMENNTESSVKNKKVTFADDTKFSQDSKIRRVFRKPRRTLTPGPQKPKLNFNPRFQALINRFENQTKTYARTSINMETKENLESTPPTGEHNMPARAINFKEESPILETERSENTKESNELFKTCANSPDQPMNNAITTLTANIASSLQTCLSSVLRTTDDETEIQFQFVITKKKVSVKRVAANEFEKRQEIDLQEHTNGDNNIWSTVARVVKNVFWGDEATQFNSNKSNDLSSSSKRKFDKLSDPGSPPNEKRQKYQGRIRGRPPLHGRCGVLDFRIAERERSAKQRPILKKMSISNEDVMNLSF